jgi:hypothetical protein
MNGDEKNWVRLCLTVDGFRARYGRWPTEVHLQPAYFGDVVGHILSPAGYALVSRRFRIVCDQDLPEDVTFVAVGNSNEKFRYGEEDSTLPESEQATFNVFGEAVIREGLDYGLDYVTLTDAEGNLVWAGKGIKPMLPVAEANKKGKSMHLAEFLSDPNNEHSVQGNPPLKCNALYKAEDNFNCYLTVSQAIAFARNLLLKAQLILDKNLDDAVVHVWNKGKSNEVLRCGLNKSRKGPRKAGNKTKPRDSKSRSR